MGQFDNVVNCKKARKTDNIAVSNTSTKFKNNLRLKYVFDDMVQRFSKSKQHWTNIRFSCDGHHHWDAWKKNYDSPFLCYSHYKLVK